MKKIFSIALGVLLTTLCHAGAELSDKNTLAEQTTASDASQQPKKKKIIIFTSRGGNGHMSTCDALKDLLPEYDIKLIRPIHDFFNSYFDEEEWYGSFLKNGWIRTGNFLARYPGTTFMNFRCNTFRDRFLKCLQDEKPDMLISVIPLINYPAAWAANRYNIPFMLITLDADLELWLQNMRKCNRHNVPLDKNVIITAQMKTPRIKKQLKKANVPLSCLREVGCPLRKDFFTPKDKVAIKKEWGIPEGKKVIMLMRGSTGSNVMVDYVTKLVKKLTTPTHLLVCIGRNAALIPQLNKIKNEGTVTFSIVQFTPKIPDLMAVSDLLISQPSPNVCNEAMHMKLPILVDMTGPCLFWEKATLDWINLRGYGKVFKNMSKLPKLAEKCLNKKKKYDSKYLKSIPDFNTEIRKLIIEKIGN